MFETSQKNSWVGVSFLEKLRPVTLWKRDSGSDVFMWIFVIFKNIYFVTDLLEQQTKVCKCIFRSTYARGTQIMFARTSSDTISSLTMHFINEVSKQTRWLWWQNQMWISGKKWYALVKCAIIPLSLVW